MKILVAVKRVVDYNVQIRVKEDGSGVRTENVKMSTNPPDDNAIEEAVKLKESGKVKEDIIFSGQIGRIRDIQVHKETGKIYMLSQDALWLMEKN